jgi:Ca2+-binding EF-hand superfamily protein
LLNFDEAPKTLREEFASWDKNKDGVIDYKEFRSFLQATLRREQNARVKANAAANHPDTPEEDRRPVVYRADNLPLDKLPPWFKDVDTDKDGQIGLYEWRRAGKSIAEFMAMDRNNDGFLTVEEVLYYQAAQTKKVGKTPGTRVAGFKTASTFPPVLSGSKANRSFTGKKGGGQGH